MQQKKEYIVNTINDLKKIILLPDINRVFIYGIGQVGILVYLLLKQNNISPSAFVCSHKNIGKIQEIALPILEYYCHLFDEKDVVIVAASNCSQKEILENCRNDYCRKIIITNDFCHKYLEIFRGAIDEILTNKGVVLYRQIKEERKTVGNYFKYTDLEDSTYKSKFLRLIRGLDFLSKETLIKCIYRVQIVNKSLDDELDIFSEEEKKQLLDMHNQLEKGIIQLGENIWTYRGYILPVNHFMAPVFYDKLGISEIENRGYCFDKDIIDVGGYIGDSALILSELTCGRIHVFEPNDSNVAWIEKTKELNQIDISIINMAVSDKKEVISFSIDKANSTSSMMEIEERSYEKKVKVQTTSIDEYVEKNNLRIGLIKIHAEGLEQKVIKGASNTIKRQNPIIITEISHTESDFFDIKPLLEDINPKYKYKIYKSTNGLVCLGLKLIAEVY